jgi:hypothetical protein
LWVGPRTQPVILQVSLPSKNKAFVHQNLQFLWLLVYFGLLGHLQMAELNPKETVIATLSAHLTEEETEVKERKCGAHLSTQCQQKTKTTAPST